MSLIAEYRFRSPKLALWDTLERVPDARLELLEEVGTDPERPFLVLRATGVDFETFERALADDETVADFEHYAEFDDSRIYRLQISAATELVIYPIWVEVGAASQEARWEDGWWWDRVRYPDREALGTVRNWFADHDVEFEMAALYDEDDRPRTATVLTPVQRDTLETALDMGYFDVPRQATIDDVADRLGVSSQAISERLRRAHRHLVEHHLSA